ncbi:uncharacterized protein SETTUDRAFT_161174 [Exserohilum turcica Et28A]|uniref:Uncharacterized protein n=1 Tax=Exserohilum turcicum (strain 28A) TaxID=671987 RepID=R0KI13_EXST2|nr:uncharacterized protein SETTUDRAFT_161174 [Exserohilum turcica Et28A]EOA87652.1 hypothetical protein SETTUDRAFT_161174 [Exserohilum turcica Et28A]
MALPFASTSTSTSTSTSASTAMQRHTPAATTAALSQPLRPHGHQHQRRQQFADGANRTAALSTA